MGDSTAAIELTSANGDKWGCLGTVVAVTSVDLKGWARLPSFRVRASLG